jgi:hypothetical protein
MRRARPHAGAAAAGSTVTAGSVTAIGTAAAAGPETLAAAASPGRPSGCEVCGTLKSTDMVRAAPWIRARAAPGRLRARDDSLVGNRTPRMEAGDGALDADELRSTPGAHAVI